MCRCRWGIYDDWVKAAERGIEAFQPRSAIALKRWAAITATLPAHAGMWRAAEDTADDFMSGRLAVVPMVLEARGLDVTPGMIEIFRSAPALDQSRLPPWKVIYAEEVGHVAYGSKWFNFLCGRHDMTIPKDAFHASCQAVFQRRR